MNILVTGIASDIGFNCGRIVRELGSFGTLHGADIHGDHAGSCLFDVCAIAPRASAPHYVSWLVDYVAQHGIAYVIPTSEAELARLVMVDDAPAGAHLLIAGRQVVDTALDKHKCLELLDAHGIPVPSHGVVGDALPTSWPVVVKPRSGQGSKGLLVAGDPDDYRRNATAGSVWQEQLLPADEEYTCPVYRSPAAGTRTLVLRRVLHGGLTGKGEVRNDAAIVRYVEAIADALDLHGAMNVQLRCTANGPRLFEINPRLSSTVMFRHRLGFRDLEWWLMDVAGRPVPEYRAPSDGTRFYRGSQEYIVEP